jgi:hypothetical protein
MNYIYPEILNTKNTFLEKISVKIEYYKYMFFFTCYRFFESIRNIFIPSKYLSPDEVFEI